MGHSQQELGNSTQNSLLLVTLLFGLLFRMHLRCPWPKEDKIALTLLAWRQACNAVLASIEDPSINIADGVRGSAQASLNGPPRLIGDGRCGLPESNSKTADSEKNASELAEVGVSNSSDDSDTRSSEYTSAHNSEHLLAEVKKLVAQAEQRLKQKQPSPDQSDPLHELRLLVSALASCPLADAGTFGTVNAKNETSSQEIAAPASVVQSAIFKDGLNRVNSAASSAEDLRLSPLISGRTIAQLRHMDSMQKRLDQRTKSLHREKECFKKRLVHQCRARRNLSRQMEMLVAVVRELGDLANESIAIEIQDEIDSRASDSREAPHRAARTADTDTATSSTSDNMVVIGKKIRANRVRLGPLLTAVLLERQQLASPFVRQALESIIMLKATEQDLRLRLAAVEIEADSLKADNQDILEALRACKVSMAASPPAHYLESPQCVPREAASFRPQSAQRFSPVHPCSMNPRRPWRQMARPSLTANAGATCGCDEDRYWNESYSHEDLRLHRAEFPRPNYDAYCRHEICGGGLYRFPCDPSRVVESRRSVPDYHVVEHHPDTDPSRYPRERVPSFGMVTAVAAQTSTTPQHSPPTEAPCKERPLPIRRGGSKSTLLSLPALMLKGWLGTGKSAPAKPPPSPSPEPINEGDEPAHICQEPFNSNHQRGRSYGGTQTRSCSHQQIVLF